MKYRLHQCLCKTHCEAVEDGRGNTVHYSILNTWVRQTTSSREDYAVGGVWETAKGAERDPGHQVVIRIVPDVDYQQWPGAEPPSAPIGVRGRMSSQGLIKGTRSTK